MTDYGDVVTWYNSNLAPSTSYTPYEWRMFDKVTCSTSSGTVPTGIDQSGWYTCQFYSVELYDDDTIYLTMEYTDEYKYQSIALWSLNTSGAYCLTGLIDLSDGSYDLDPSYRRIIQLTLPPYSKTSPYSISLVIQRDQVTDLDYELVSISEHHHAVYTSNDGVEDLTGLSSQITTNAIRSADDGRDSYTSRIPYVSPADENISSTISTVNQYGVVDSNAGSSSNTPLLYNRGKSNSYYSKVIDFFDRIKFRYNELNLLGHTIDTITYTSGSYLMTDALSYYYSSSSSIPRTLYIVPGSYLMTDLEKYLLKPTGTSAVSYYLDYSYVNTQYVYVTNESNAIVYCIYSPIDIVIPDSTIGIGWEKTLVIPGVINSLTHTGNWKWYNDAIPDSFSSPCVIELMWIYSYGIIYMWE